MNTFTLFAYFYRVAADTSGIGKLSLPNTNPALTASDTPANTVAVLLADRVAQLLIAVAFPLAFIAITYSVYVLLMSQGNPDGYKKVKKNLLNGLIGIFLLVFATILVKFIYNIFSF